MNVEVCLPSKFRPQKLHDTIESLLSRSIRWDTGIAVGIDTDDRETMELVLDLRKKWSVNRIRVDINRPEQGHVVAMNTLIRGSLADIVVVFADDCRMHSDGWDAHIQKHFFESSLVCLGLCCPLEYLEQLKPKFGAGVNDNMGYYYFTVDDNRWTFPFPAVFAFRRSFFSVVGLFDPRFRRWFGDVDFATTLFIKGSHVEICRNIHCFSYDSHTSDQTTLLAAMTVEESHQIYVSKWFTKGEYRSDTLVHKLLSGDLQYWCRESIH